MNPFRFLMKCEESGCFGKVPNRKQSERLITNPIEGCPLKNTQQITLLVPWGDPVVLPEEKVGAGVSAYYVPLSMVIQTVLFVFIREGWL